MAAGFEAESAPFLPQQVAPRRNRSLVIFPVGALVCLGIVAYAGLSHYQLRTPVELLSAEKPWGVDFDLKFDRGERQWQITNLVLHPPPPPPPADKTPPSVMTKPTFPFYELQAMNKAEAEVSKKMDDPDTDPKVKEALQQGMSSNSGAMESAIGCAEGAEPGSSIKTACPGIGSGKPQEVTRQWNMGFPPQEGAAGQQGAAYKRRGLVGGDVDRGQEEEAEK
eukprot:CAMPEP_0181307396 /NCGR_PEP_ID=MMETSP1101-20121128/10855_1 /TAXON_ID=46948 /ORGANISM="Rhodomonas abbreviata, Strain Caron Lab Isolate" /LENGTH=222 /DNA_ID=CAMNT_0023413605 /DNA_START=86 /DNA_END=754 /DNA_ORIENTATION=+